ncbi:serine-rich adhesin for platelets isoform X2 [Nasonia vitripennis]|uniref:Uncharacterized protein n=1 Tax=Nasonia vitripennis TaxID=7425 RepID=A0A7M7QQD9_NASVI|nr:serine-rich adhesin for platelets isoform X2 [Nasonia vitripennis]XP_032452075.1 serine-rich adhesin for platelets isoform X2 [Nasonia vitripennis]
MSSHIQKLCAGLEATLSDSKKKYIDKVNALLAAWEQVTSYVANSPDTSEYLIEWANEHTLELVLRGEWPKLAPAHKTHLNVTLQRCASQLAQKQQLGPSKRCLALSEFVQNPWSKPGLDRILNGQSAAAGSEHEEDEFCCQESGQLLNMRLKILCEDRCEDIAVNLAAACVRSLSRSDRLSQLSAPSHVQYIMDVYIVLLYKLKRTHDIVAQLKLMDLKDGLEMMQRLSGEKPTKYGTARVWRNSGKAAGLVAQYLVTTGMVRPIAEVGPATLEQILNSWALLHAKSKDQVATLPGIIRKLIEPAESAHHIYIFCQILVRHFGEAIKPLVIELYIRALTTDMNELENQKSKANKEKVQETAQRLSQEFLRLADYVSDSIGTASECVLTAFSLHPTRACYDRIKELAIACGKVSREELDFEGVKIKTEPKIEGEEKLNETESVTELNCTATQALTEDDSTRIVESTSTKVETSEVQIKKEPDQDIDVSTTTMSTPSVENSQDEPILVKSDPATDLADCDEKAVASQVLNSEKLGLSPQLYDDLAVVLSSQRYHVLTWCLEWKELSELCERYLENAEEMRNTNKELKYLNIDYSQFKDQPYEYDPRDNHYGIEKGYEKWNDSDYSESEAANGTQQSLGDSSDTDSEALVVQPVKRGRPRKVQRLDSSESEYDRKPSQRFKKGLLTSSESDSNTQDSQTDSLGSDGCKKNMRRITKKKTCNGAAKKVTKRRPKKTKITVDSVSHFDILVNENIRPSSGLDGIGDNSSNDIMTIFSADMDENNRETIKGSAAFNAANLIMEKRTNPEVIKTLRMYRPNNKKLSQINQKNAICKNNVSIKKENNNVSENNANGLTTKFAPMLSTLNLNPKISLRRVDEIDKRIVIHRRQQQAQAVNAGALSNRIRNIQKTMSLSKGSLAGFSKQKALAKGPTQPRSRTKSKLEEMLTKKVPGMHSMEFSVLPRVQSTVHVVQLSRNVSQSPNSTASGNTPPRNRSNIQLPGTPSSGGHDSGVGMSPAGQTPPPPTRSSSLQDVGEEANQSPDTSPLNSTNTSSTMDSTDGTRTVALAVLNQRVGSNQSPKKSTSPSTNNASTVNTEQQLLLRKPDGTLQLVTPGMVTTGQRSILSLQNFEDGNIGFARQVPVASVAGTEIKTIPAQANRNTGLPKFQQAFGKTICTLSTESTTVPSSSASDTHEAPAAPAGAATNVQRAVAVKSTPAGSNITKSVQTSVQNVNIANIPNLQVAGTRQILNIVQSAVSSANSNVTTAGGQTLQLCSVPNSTPGVIYAHKVPGGNPVISLPAAISNNRSPVQLKLNIIRTAPFRSASGAVQVLTSRIQPQQQQQQPQQQQAQPQQPQTVRPADTLMNSTMDMSTNQVSSSTLEQLREFESVLEQVKERSTSQSSSTDTTTVQTQTQTVQSNTTAKQPQSQQISVSTLGQQLLMSSQSPSSAVEFPSNGNTVTFQQQEVYPQKVALMYTNQNSGTATSKVVNSTPVVVVTSYCQPAASPALSVTSQSSSSPCVTPAPQPVSSTGKTQPQSAAKSAKKAAPKTVKVTAQAAAKAAPIPKPQQKPQEDPETTQRIYAILGQYAEQLRNSPDLNNKPAPRRRSNPPTNPNQSSKRKKSGSGKSSKGPSGQQTSEPSPSAEDMGRTMGSEDSSGGGGGGGSGTGSSSAILQVQDSPAGFSASEETLASGSNNNSQSAVNDNATLGSVTETRSANSTSDSNDGVEVNVKRRNLIFAEPNTGGQTRTVIVQETVQPSSVGETLASVTSKMTTGTAVLVSGTNFMLPMNFVKSGQQITVVSGGSKLLAAVPTVRTAGGGSGVSNAFVLQSLLSQANKVIQQQHQQKQVKLQTQQGQIVVPQQTVSSGGAVRFNNEDSGENKTDSIKLETSKVTPTTTIGLFQHSGVITSNPNIGQRIFNSSSVKLPVKATEAGVQAQQQVVCIAAPTSVKEPEAQKVATTLALAFASTNDTGSTALQIKKETKETETLTCVDGEKMMSPKTVKRKEEQSFIGVADVLTQSNTRAEPTQPLNRKIKQSTSPVPALTPTTTSSSSLDTATQFLVSGGPSSSDSRESASSTIQSSVMESTSMDDVKVENGVLCGNARLQEAWEPERKGSPDTPWRYTPTTNALGIEPIKVYSRDAENSETVHNSVLQIISKGQGIEMSSSGIFQTNKYQYHAMNNSIDSFQKFPAKILTKSSPANNARATAEHEHQQRLLDRKQQMIERELRLQKSLSEECEDLGVDEPSTSDLFPEADLLFDTNHSPAFDHSSQEASCSQTLSVTTTSSGIKSYSTSSNTTSFFKSLDTVSSVGRVASPVVVAANPTPEPKKKAPLQRRTPKPKPETQMRKNKRSSDGLQTAASGSTTGGTTAKQLRLGLAETSSQDEASNSNSDISRLSPLPADDSFNQKAASRNGSKDREGTPSSSRSSLQSHAKLEMDMDSSHATANLASATSDATRRVVNVNNVSSTASSGEDDEGLTLLEDSAASVTIQSPLSPIAGPLLMTQRYTYANNKRRPAPAKQSQTSDFFSNTRTTLSWESPMSERTRSSTDNDEEEEEDLGDESSSISEAFGTSQLEASDGSGMGNGLQEPVKNVPSVKVTPVDHATYAAKRKTPVPRRTTINHSDSNIGVGNAVLNKSGGTKSSGTAANSSAAKKAKIAATSETTAISSITTTTSENESSSPAPSTDKIYEVSPSDDEASTTTIMSSSTLDASVEHCSTGRRSSLRGQVKKACGCCNGTPEPPKTKKVVVAKPQQLDQNNSKLKRAKQQQQAKQLAKKR